MNIFFDYEVKEIEISTSTKDILEEFRIFIIQRISIFNDKLDLYPDGFIVINLFPFIEECPVGLIIYGYPDDIKNMINRSLTPDDWAYIQNKISTTSI